TSTDASTRHDPAPPANRPSGTPALSGLPKVHATRVPRPVWSGARQEMRIRPAATQGPSIHDENRRMPNSDTGLGPRIAIDLAGLRVARRLPEGGASSSCVRHAGITPEAIK